MFKYLLVAALVPSLVLANTPHRRCANGADLPQSVNINGCTFSPCNIQNGHPIMASALGITSPVPANQLKAHITVRLSGLQVPFPMPEGLEDACAIGTAHGTCPVSAGQTFDYHLNHHGMPLSVSGVTVQIEVGLRNENGQNIACLEFDAHIMN